MAGISKLLVANRGEIAVRVLRAARGRGYRTVAVHSEADATALHVKRADEAVEIGPPPAADSYLSIERIVDAAKSSGADAVHPGYGFLAESADFAEACIAAGLVFVGPKPDAIRRMGDKSEARRLMAAAGVPCIPGYDGDDQDLAMLEAKAREIGLPLMVKARAGGGGRGMRLVTEGDDLAAAIAAARSEAEAAFGDGGLLLERALGDTRHVEVQVLADRHGNTVHLGERDCSVQRRHQKVIEEAPSPAVDEDLRRAIGEAAVAAARAVDYEGAGTVEFLLGADGAFHFLEMNTRIQVEHPVTEMVTGVDLVDLQLAIAEGAPLPFGQDDVRLTGHAIEARLYAEDAAAGFAPQAGRVAAWRPALGDGVRIDTGIEAGTEVTPYYDPMIAKIVALGQDRDEARQRLIGALDETVILGLTTNRDFLARVLADETFARGEATTTFLEAHFVGDSLGEARLSDAAIALAAALISRRDVSLWDGWRSAGRTWWPIKLAWPDGEAQAEVELAKGVYKVRLGDFAAAFEISAFENEIVRFRRDGAEETAHGVFDEDDVLHLAFDGAMASFHEATMGKVGEAAGDDDGALLAPMAGTVIDVAVAPGDAVEKGQCLVVIEAMKIQHEIRAASDGVVAEARVAVGDQVDSRQTLIVLEPRAEELRQAGE
ncbi:MAG: acetyl-CoA carboxylase biotin carboxylase subunit [Alphaproteobacteria bacterium]|nr:acetyl-CoA carboxylase biotin carboxylase subunit [Alphaproteobacteria bacterium]